MSHNNSPVPTFEELQKILADHIPNFPKNKLRNRLKNTGVKEFLEGAVGIYGFPFKYITHRDEAILALAYFLERFRSEPETTLNVYGIHILPKGEDKTLASWVTEKAKLYLEIQNLILLLDGVENRKSNIKRVFVFRDFSDLAFLTETAVSVINEQRAMGIEIGFVFASELNEYTEQIDFLSNSLIIEFKPEDKFPEKPNFYTLYDESYSNNVHYLPYQQKCFTRWYKKRPVLTVNAPLEILNPHLKTIDFLFEEKNWKEFSRNSDSLVHRLPNIGLAETGEADFNSNLYTMYTAYLRAKNKGLTSNVEQVLRRFNEKVVTASLIRLEKAARAFDNSYVKTIKAIDPSSVKNTLRLHEAEPLYRGWLRKSLNRVIRKDSKTHLYRIYIFDDTKEPKQLAKEEYDSLLRNMQYYLDYFNYEIFELKQIATNHLEKNQAKKTSWEKEIWKSLQSRVKIYVTTKSIIKEFWQKIPKDNQQLIEKILEEFASDMDGLNSEPYENLSKIDFLFAEVNNPNKKGDACNVIYKFDNPRADPGELEFTASLMRDEFDDKSENSKLYRFISEPDDDMLMLLREQKLRRAGLMLKSISDYKTSYGSVAFLSRIFEEEEKKIAEVNIKERISEWIKHSNEHGIGCQHLKSELDSNEFTEQLKTITQIRKKIESELYKYFEKRADYLFELLKCFSVEVEFFDRIDRLSETPQTQEEEQPPADLRHASQYSFWRRAAAKLLTSFGLIRNFNLLPSANIKIETIQKVYPFSKVFEVPSADQNQNSSVELRRIIRREIDERLKNSKFSFPRFREKRKKSAMGEF